jgi:hypothetical protein
VIKDFPDSVIATSTKLDVIEHTAARRGPVFLFNPEGLRLETFPSLLLSRLGASPKFSGPGSTRTVAVVPASIPVRNWPTRTGRS